MSDDPGEGAPRSEPAGAGQPGLVALFRRLIQLITLQNILTIVEIIGVPVAIWALWLTYGQSRQATEQIEQAQEQIKLGTTQVELAQQALRDQRVSSAWQILATEGNGSTGKQYALGMLMNLDGRLVGIDLSCEPETRGTTTACYQPADLRELTLSPGVQPDGTPRPAVIEQSAFRDAVLYRARFSDISFTNVDFSDADLFEASFANSVLDRVNFSGADLDAASFAQTLLIEVDFSGVNLTSTNFETAEYSHSQAREMLLAAPDDINVTGATLCTNGSCAPGLNQAFLDQAWYLASSPPLGMEQLDATLMIMSGCVENQGIPDRQLHDRYTCDDTMISVAAVTYPMPTPGAVN